MNETQSRSQDPAAGAGETPHAEAKTYEAASARVEEIIRRLDSGEASLDETVALVGEGKQLIEFCAQELESVSGTLEELRLDELVARLERGATEAGAAGPAGAAGAGAAGPAGAGAAGPGPTKPQ